MHHPSRWSLLAGLVFAITMVPLLAQQPQFRTSTNLRTIDVVVLDRQGQPVTDLTSADFEVTEHGKRQSLKQAIYVPAPLTRASLSTPANSSAADAGREAAGSPRFASAQEPIAQTLAIVVDDLGLSFESTVYVRKALHTFIDTQMQSGDLIAILRTGAGIGSLQQFTTDRRLLSAAAEHVQWTVISRKGIGSFEPIDHLPFEHAQRGSPRGASTTAVAGVEDGTGTPPPGDPDDGVEGLRQSMLTVWVVGCLGICDSRTAAAARTQGRDLFFGRIRPVRPQGPSAGRPRAGTRAGPCEPRGRGDLHHRCARPADGRRHGGR
jgi:hypothetical protein